MTNPDDRVYPIYDGNSITKRELFAAMVFQGFAADPTTNEDDWLLSSGAESAVEWADALIAALNKNKGE